MLKIAPLQIKESNALIARWHRHHKPVRGHKFSIGVYDDHTGEYVGAAIVGRPVARLIDHRRVLEVTRLVTDGTRNACSILYAACARICKELGYMKIQTYILKEEPGTSLIAAGWEYETDTKPVTWTRKGRPGRRTDQPMGAKQRWSKILRTDEFPAFDIDKFPPIDT